MKKKVTLYALSTCPWCQKAKRFFANNNIPVKCIDYDLASDEEQERIMEEVEDLGGTGEFPFVVIGDQPVSGYDPNAYARYLGMDR
jgi:glutaredoxin